jgi:hypothetical protein
MYRAITNPSQSCMGTILHQRLPQMTSNQPSVEFWISNQPAEMRLSYRILKFSANPERARLAEEIITPSFSRVP